MAGPGFGSYGQRNAGEVRSNLSQLGPHLAEVALELGSELGDVALEFGPELGDVALELGPELGDVALELGPELGDVAFELGPAIQDGRIEPGDLGSHLRPELSRIGLDLLTKVVRHAGQGQADRAYHQRVDHRLDRIHLSSFRRIKGEVPGGYQSPPT